MTIEYKKCASSMANVHRGIANGSQHTRSTSMCR